MIFFIILYIIFLIAYGIFFYIAFYHLRRYGYKEGASSTMMTVYCIISVAIVILTIILLSISGLTIPDNFGINI